MCTHQLTDEELFCLQGCRSYKQYYRMRRRFEKGECLFCTMESDLIKIVWEDEHACAWSVHPDLMRSALKYHLIVIPKKHVRFEHSLTDQEAVSVHRAKQALSIRFPYSGGMTMVREGDMRLNAGTVPHLHYNIFVPNKTGEVRVPIFKGVNSLRDNFSRAKDFANRYESAEIPN